jgi:putative ABC transport system permease protein
MHTERWESMVQLVSDGYFPTLGLRLVRGRLLTEAEVNDGRKVAVVNQTLVNRYFGPENPLGRSIRFTELEKLQNNQAVANPVFEIIGVIADAKNRGIREAPMPEAFVPYTLTGAYQRGVLVRTMSAPDALLNSVRREIWAVDRHVALTNTGTLTDFLKQFSYAEPRFSLTLLGVFAAVGLLLVSIGVYSVIAYTVARQTHEIGIRMALGAGRVDVLRMVASMGLRLVAIGVTIGLLASLVVTRIISSQIWGVSPHDPLTLTTVVSVMAGVGLAACYFPARRATRVDPMVALRCE